MKGKSVTIGFFVFLLILISICIYNMLCNYSEFFKTNISFIITAVIAVFISYYLVQQKNDERKQKEMICDLIGNIVSLICEQSLTNFDGDYKRSLHLSKMRSISNRIDLLYEAIPPFLGVDTISSAKDNWDYYKATVDECSDNIETLKTQIPTLKRSISLLEDKLTRLQFQLFNLCNDNK